MPEHQFFFQTGGSQLLVPSLAVTKIHWKTSWSSTLVAKYYKLFNSIRLIFVEHLKIPPSQIIMYIYRIYSARTVDVHTSSWARLRHREGGSRRRSERNPNLNPSISSNGVSRQSASRKWEFHVRGEQHKLELGKRRKADDFFRKEIIITGSLALYKHTRTNQYSCSSLHCELHIFHRKHVLNLGPQRIIISWSVSRTYDWDY